MVILQQYNRFCHHFSDSKVGTNVHENRIDKRAETKGEQEQVQHPREFHQLYETNLSPVTAPKTMTRCCQNWKANAALVEEPKVKQ